MLTHSLNLLKLIGRSLLDIPDDQLDDVELAEKKRQKIKEDAKKGKFLFQYFSPAYLHSTLARDQRSDPQYVESLVLQRNAILERKAARQKVHESLVYMAHSLPNSFRVDKG